MNESERVSQRALADVATRAARAGGDYLADEFRTGHVEAEYSTDDVKAVADREAEARVLDAIRAEFPGHALHGEESGRQGDSEYEWVVDPLDGTNNFASGLPAFATAVAVLHDGDPVVSAIYEPLPDTLYVARDGVGATVNGDPLSTGSDVALDNGTVSFVVGLPAVRDETLSARADEIERALGDRVKRVVTTWSPCVDWGLVARGALEGIVCFHPDVYEQYAGELLARGAGVASRSENGIYVGAADGATRDALFDAVRN
ncbi:myo-inositol-1(or 4)-monophosphatase [Halogranum gelatinilyticum]|uniref:fructose-bisphosphatase n=1 Tax=Halogranum gelatinilyticum TaxID=660521 RepID=A0A1G9RBI0_9EURY|nr:inositol monophosphatase [Halogranum gelatinilyticum]SDM19755.1 myo-inositol-1(or 4)-monophosphatase [Halogranum gelatinilyticum]